MTFLFTDIEGSTRLAQMLGASYRSVLTAHRRLLRRTIGVGQGAELCTEGDSFFVVFSDARAALRACHAAQRALATYPWPDPQAVPLVRMGLHTGYAEPQGGEYASPEVHRAARIAAAAHGGQVLCSGATARLIGVLPEPMWLQDLGLHLLRGFDDPERLHQLVAPGLERRFPRPRTAARVSHNLPAALTPFVGRTTDQAQLRALLVDHRLVTVVGTGGAGKTRLAVEVAAQLPPDYPDGVWFVDLAEVGAPRGVAAAVARALGVRPEPGREVLDTVAEYAAARRLLLVLDTCDAQLPGVVQVVSRLLTAGTEARILATSREPSGVPGELVWRIPPLSLRPGPDDAPSDALSLLLDRASAACGGERPHPADAADLGRVAARLGGHPLALVLAAARLRVLSPAQLAERLDDVLGTLDAGRGVAPTDSCGIRGTLRHLSMHASVTWSYRTLSEPAAELLTSLAVFAGPVDLAAIEWLVGRSPLDPLTALVEKSLVRAEPTRRGVRYRLVEPVRAYAAHRLAESGAEPPVRDRHVAWVLDAVQRVRFDADGRPVTPCLDALDSIMPEVRGALAWTATAGSARLGLQLVGGVDPWWTERGLTREGREWLFRQYGRIATTGELISDAELAAVYHLHSRHAGVDGEWDEEERFCGRAEAAARRAADPGLLARVRAGRAAGLARRGRLTAAETACREVIAWSGGQGVPGDALAAVYWLTAILWRRGALDEAADLLGAARPVEAARPGDRGRRGVDLGLGLVALVRGDLVAAHEHLVVALRSRVAHGYRASTGDAIGAIAARCVLGGDHVTGARLFGAAEAARAPARAQAREPARAPKRTDGGLLRAFWAEQQAAARAAIGDAAFDAAYAAGNALSRTEATAEALAVEHPDLAADSVRFSNVSSRTA